MTFTIFALQTIYNMDILLIILGAICLIVGLAGCIAPMLPGPPLSYVGLLLLHFTSQADFTTTELLVWLAIVIAVLLLDYFVPMLGTKYFGGSKWGSWGCVIGTIAGLFFMPLGIVLGPFIGALVGELLGGSRTRQALKASLGSLIGFLFGTVLKCIACGYFIYIFIAELIK